MLALRFIKPLRVPGKLVPEAVEIDALAAGDWKGPSPGTVGSLCAPGGIEITTSFLSADSPFLPSQVSGLPRGNGVRHLFARQRV